MVQADLALAALKRKIEEYQVREAKNKETKQQEMAKEGAQWRSTLQQQQEREKKRRLLVKEFKKRQEEEAEVKKKTLTRLCGTWYHL